ncbi:MAG: DUF362 domain-containing protein [Clostridiales bacterium]|nr:DUF362 domain-containing protein [Clostridiales bacterium]
MSKVIIKECKDYNLDNLIEKINQGIGRLGGWDLFVKPGDKVLLKVNLIGPKSSDSGAVTHCEFVRALTRILKQRGCEVWIGDSSGGALAGVAPTVQSFRASGIEKVANEEGALIKNFDKEGVVEVLPNGKFKDKMYLAKPIYDADLVINLPKFKTHMMGVYTGAIKNVFGCIPGLRKAKYHKIAVTPRSFGEILADIHECGRFHLHIMDGIQAMQGEGPTAGSVYQANKILISKDPLALDVVAIKMLGLDIKQVPILAASKQRKIGEGDLEKIEIEGDYQSIPRLKRFGLPVFHWGRLRNFAMLIPFIEFMRSKPKVNLKKCKKCNVCVESCPVEAIDKDTKKINYKECIECLCCHELCMYKAIDLKRFIVVDLVFKSCRTIYRLVTTKLLNSINILS